MCDRTPNCPDRKLLPAQLEVIRELTDVLPFSGAEQNYREACIDLMLETNERVHTGFLTESAIEEATAMTEHLREGLELLDRAGIDRLPFGDPKRNIVDRVRLKHLEVVRAINDKYGDKVEAHHKSMKDGLPPDQHESLLALARAVKNAELLPFTPDEANTYGARVDRLREIGETIFKTSPIAGLAMVIESIRLVREQCLLEREVAEGSCRAMRTTRASARSGSRKRRSCRAITTSEDIDGGGRRSMIAPPCCSS